MLDKRRWHHVVVTTYGAWLPGDVRGYRTRHRRGLVVGDYQAPPPDHQYVNLRNAVSKELSHAPVCLPQELRGIVGSAMHLKLARHGMWALCISVSGQHAHLLVRLISEEARRLIGMAKKHASFELRSAGWQGKVWGVRSKIDPIKSRSHQVNAYRYITQHAEQGAWVGSWRDDPLQIDG